MSLVIKREAGSRSLLTWLENEPEPSTSEVLEAMRAELPFLGARLGVVRMTIQAPGLDVRLAVELMRAVNDLAEALGVRAFMSHPVAVPGTSGARLGIELKAVDP